MAVADAVSSAVPVEVTVRAIAAGGSGVGQLPDGRVVFVPRTAPGDRVAVRIEKDKPRWAVARVDRMVAPSTDRRDALCALYHTCGGCQLQHLPYGRQLEWKGRIVADALTRLGGLGAVEPPEVVPSPRTTGYRNRMTFTLRRLRGGRTVAGLHALGRPGHVIDVQDECVLPEPELAQAWVDLRRGWGPGARLLPAGGRLRLMLRALEPGFELVIEGGERAWRPQELVERVPRLVTVHHIPGGADRTKEAGGDDTPATLGTAFVQVNRSAAPALEAHVQAVAGDGEHAVDAYCGVGVYGRTLAQAGWRVVGIELDPAAVSIAEGRAPAGFTVERGRVEELLDAHLPVDLLIVNPPRTGLDERVPHVVLAAPPNRIVYVSCDPATLARDVAALSSTYDLSGLRAFDLFPQTAHVETVAVLDRRAAGA